MALVVPKIIFPSGGGTTFTFVRPPRFVPYKTYQSIRHDNISSAGVKETIYERRDEFLNFEMEFVKNDGADIVAWDTFMKSALQGINFDYYPDSTSGTNTTYILENTDWEAAYKQLGEFTFKCSFRKRVAWP